MNYTTADYLESLQDDLSRTVEALDLEEGTNFTDIADMAENGDISTGGGDLSEYFETYAETNTGAQATSFAKTTYVKKFPDIIVGNEITSLANFFVGWLERKAPKIISGSNVTGLYQCFKDCTNMLTVDLSGITTPQLLEAGQMFLNCTNLKNIDFSNLRPTGTFSMYGMFEYCGSLQSVNLSGVEHPTNIKELFYECRALTYIDIRSMEFSNVSNYNNTFDGVPSNCLIIVKDNTAKTWLKGKFSRLTNIKTVAEYEGS